MLRIRIQYPQIVQGNVLANKSKIILRLQISFRPGRIKTVGVTDKENKRSGHNCKRYLGFLSRLSMK